MTRVHRYWCEWALVGPHPAAAAGVLIEVADGRIRGVRAGEAAPSDAERLQGLTVAGFANAHSHAFHRALRGRTGEHGGSFWTWRERMYAVAAALDPDSYHRLARAVYAEMALAGVTCVGEFHYLHHGPGGVPYSDPNAMSAALVAAAADAGIRITLLDACYLSGGLDADGKHTQLRGTQLRFGDASFDAWAHRVADYRPDGTHALLGAAVHSVRAVPEPDLRAFVRHYDALAEPWPAVHIHLSEQPAENASCLAAHGRTPTGLLADTGFLDRTAPTLVHATHLTDDDLDLLRAARSRAVVCLCPTTERDLADGLARTADFGAEVPVSLGSDGHSTIDMLEEARAVEMHERLRTGRRGTVDASRLLESLHTTGHAGSLGWKDAGALGAGNRADLVTIGLDSVRLAGFDPDRASDAVVFAATAADVRHVMADGRWIVRDGVHQLIPDAARVLDQAIKEL
ncbi:formimidoylglutamate deiminase [Nocardiopsis ansamitocini]|uniref:Formimidoylglutamate deiminase n=1 Tax=Nocardiopsis ansamitocini TaxID=1670832 RepID=A0A9W6UKU3_9ACTN|nr:formimidoylglutamate deiminase [Nocardiopsis ansamitocini]GLU49415.1 formimidoylglutamate deiminase [Nocardiopsis ansamitocini]